MKRRSTGRSLASLVLSVLVHAIMAAFLLFVPEQVQKRFETVKLDVARKEQIPEVPQEEKPVEPEPEKVKPKAKPKPKEVEPEPPPEEEPKEQAKEAPPVFDLGDNTFATGDGQPGSWTLNRSEGNTKIAGFSKKNESLRGTQPVRPEGGGGDGLAPVPLKDLSQRPKPKKGDIALPPYPMEARREGIEGAVVLQVFIDRQGRVRRARIIKDPGGGLGAVALSSMLKEEWTPPLDKKGRPVDTVIIYSYRFVLDG